MADDVLGDKTNVLSFPLYHSLAIDRTSEEYQKNLADWTQVLKTYQEGLEWTASQGTAYYEDRHKERGLLLGVFITVILLMSSS
jgi:hypothetical protein